jgi:hypothetical protein
VVAAKCDLEWLVAGLHQLVHLQDHDEMDWIRCDTFDKFAIDIGVQHEQISPEVKVHDLPATVPDQESVDSESAVEDQYATKLEFYRLCLALAIGGSSAGLLVGTTVLTK